MKILNLAAAACVLLASTMAGAADLKPFVGGSWQTLLKAHAGKPLVVHFWGLTEGEPWARRKARIPAGDRHAAIS